MGMLFLVPPRKDELPADRDMFDVRFTPESLQVRLRKHTDCFTDDGNGGLACRECKLPAVYRTLYLKIKINRMGVERETTRSLPVCVVCHGWDDQVAHLCLATEEGIAKKLTDPDVCPEER